MLDAKSTSLMTTLTYKEKSSLLHIYFITFFLMDLIRNKYSVLRRYLVAYLVHGNTLGLRTFREHEDKNQH